MADYHWVDEYDLLQKTRNTELASRINWIDEIEYGEKYNIDDKLCEALSPEHVERRSLQPLDDFYPINQLANISLSDSKELGGSVDTLNKYQYDDNEDFCEYQHKSDENYAHGYENESNDDSACGYVSFYQEDTFYEFNNEPYNNSYEWHGHDEDNGYRYNEHEVDTYRYHNEHDDDRLFGHCSGYDEDNDYRYHSRPDEDNPHGYNEPEVDDTYRYQIEPDDDRLFGHCSWYDQDNDYGYQRRSAENNTHGYYDRSDDDNAYGYFHDFDADNTYGYYNEYDDENSYHERVDKNNARGYSYECHKRNDHGDEPKWSQGTEDGDRTDELASPRFKANPMPVPKENRKDGGKIKRRVEKEQKNCKDLMKPKSRFHVGHYILKRYKPHETRGYVLIIMNTQFKKLGKLSSGGQHDQLKSMFERLDFTVRVFKNIEAGTIKTKINEYANRRGSCFICFMSSHGGKGKVYGSDDKSVVIEDLFRKADTEALNNKPKCFFIDACRSDHHATDYVECRAPDFFIGFSSLSRQSSMDVGGGLYLKHLIRVFRDCLSRPAKEHGKLRDIKHFHDQINSLLKKDGRQQCICKSTLTKTLILHRNVD